MKTLKLSALALVGAFFFISQGASAQQTTKKAVAKDAKVTTQKIETKAVATTDAAKNMAPSAITWKDDTHNFNDIEKGKPVSHDFTFKNTTKQTVLLTDVKASCGCTATNYTKTPIKPGESGSVTATFNAASPGSFSKNITVTTSDSDVKKILTIKGKVLTPASEATPATQQ